MDRIEVPRKLSAILLFRNDHICCICRERNKDVEIHHIDGKNSNNTWSNLAVVCRDCHSKVTGSRGLGRGYLPEEVARYKDEWERAVRKRRSLLAGARSSAPKIGRDLLLFEIKRATYELASTDDAKRSKAILEYLEMFYIFDRASKLILDELKQIAPFVSDKPKGALVVEYALHYFWHLIGAEDVKAKNSDLKLMEKASDLFLFMAQMQSAIEETASMKAIMDGLHELYEIAEDYKLLGIQKMLIKRMKSVEKELVEVVGQKKHPLKKRIDKYLSKMVVK